MDEKQYIDKSQWTALHGDVRFKLRQVFSIALTESPNVVDDRVISDGVSETDLRNTFSVTAMRAHLGRKTGECDELFAAVIEKALKGEASPEPVEEVPVQAEETAPVASEAPVEGGSSRPKRKTTKKK